MWRSLPDCSAPTRCTVMRIVTKLGSFAYHLFFFLSAKFRDCIFFPSWGAIFNVPECIFKYFKNCQKVMIYVKILWKMVGLLLLMCFGVYSKLIWQGTAPGNPFFYPFYAPWQPFLAILASSGGTPTSLPDCLIICKDSFSVVSALCSQFCPILWLRLTLKLHMPNITFIWR